MKITDKNMLKVGDLIRFHSWGVGGFLFGVIIECEEDRFHNKIGVWRPNSRFELNDIDAIELIEKDADVKEYALHDFQDLMNDIKKSNITCNFCVLN